MLFVFFRSEPCTRVAYTAAPPYVSVGSYSHGAKDQTSMDVVHIKIIGA